MAFQILLQKIVSLGQTGLVLLFGRRAQGFLNSQGFVNDQGFLIDQGFSVGLCASGEIDLVEVVVEVSGGVPGRLLGFFEVGYIYKGQEELGRFLFLKHLIICPKLLIVVMNLILHSSIVIYCPVL